MIGSLTRAFDSLFGRGEAAVTVPPLDGVLRPNRALDEATVRIALPEVDCLAVHSGGLVASAGDAIHVLTGDGTWTRRRSYGSPVACIASVGTDALAVALDSGYVLIEGGRFDGRRYRVDSAVSCITAMGFADGMLYVANGSATGTVRDWQRDLLERNSTGSIWRIDLEAGTAGRMADGLAWPAGIAIDPGGLVVSEAWRHRLVRIDLSGKARPVVLLGDLPGYPGRLSPAAGGYWLSVFAPRSQLVELVLREPAYRKRMIAEVPRDYWVAPKLRSGRSYYEPLQGGGVKHLGMLKPWAPTMSFGMGVWLDPGFRARFSLQSRADGGTHGVTSVIEHEGSAVAAARGDGVVVRLPAKGGEA